MQSKIKINKIVLFAMIGMASAHIMAQQDTTLVLEEITVSARYKAVASVAGLKIPVRQIPQSISVITPITIEERNLNTVDEALQQVTGVTTIVNDNMRSQYKARGYNMSVMYDGLPSYNSLAISQQLDLSFYEQVEVLRGPAGLLQGTPGEQSIGGVINLVKKRTGDEIGIHTTISTGSWDNYRSEIDLNVPLNASKTLRSRWMVLGNDRNFFYERSHQTKTGAYGIIEWDATPSTLINASYSFQNTKSDVVFTGIPATMKDANDMSREILPVDRSTNPTPDWDWTKWKTHDIFFSARREINKDWQATLKANYRIQEQENKYAWAGTVRLSDTTSNYTFGYNYDDIPRLASALDVTGKFMLFNQEHIVFAGFNIETFEQAKKALSGGNRVQWGNPELVLDFSIPYDQLNQSKMRITQNGFYGQLRLSVANPLKIILGGRIGSVYAKMYDLTNSKWNNVLEEKNRFTPFAGIVYTPLKQLTFYASYSDIFVPQTEKKADDSMLDPRSGSQYEAGAKSEFFNDRLNVNFAFFYMEDNGRAYRVDPAVPVFVNGGKVDNKGIDVEINGNPLDGIELIAGYTYLKTKIVKSSSGDEGLAFSPVEPEHSFKFWGTYRFNDSVFKGFSMGLGVMAFSSKYASVLTPERKQESYSVVNAFIGYSINPHFSFNLNLNNILDTTYYTRVGGNGDFFGDPRNIILTARCKF